MFKVGDAVCVNDGRIGMVIKTSDEPNYTIQFGPDGPFEVWSRLRWATETEVKACGLDGVGGLNVRLPRHVRTLDAAIICRMQKAEAEETLRHYLTASVTRRNRFPEMHMHAVMLTMGSNVALWHVVARALDVQPEQW